MSAPPKNVPAPSLRATLLRSIGGLALTLVALAALATGALHRLGGAVGTILKENYASVVACDEMDQALERQDSAALFSASGRDDIARPMLEHNRALFNGGYAKEAANLTIVGEGEAVDEIDARYRDYTREVDGALAAPLSTRTRVYFDRLLPRFQSLKARVREVRALNQTSMENADREARALAARTLRVAMSVSVVALVLSFFLARGLGRGILRPIEALAAHAHAIGEGRLDEPLIAPGVTELRPLAEAMTRMQAKLRAYRQSSLGELLAAKDLSRATVECMLDPVVVFGARGQVLLANEAAERIFDLKPGDGEELLYGDKAGKGEPPEGIVHARDEVLAGRGPVLPESLSDAMRWVGVDGERAFLVRAAPLMLDGGEGAALVLAQDVTRLRRIDALKSDVVATVSHELKTPLTSLRLATHMLLDPATGPVNDVQRELCETARGDTERLQTTVDELLDLVRIEREAGALRRSSIAPSSLIDEAIAAHKAIAQMQGVTLEGACDPVAAGALAVEVSVDAEQLGIVLANLIGNAIRHTPRGGSVAVRAGVASSGALTIAVRDTGEGIAPDVLPMIFERRWSGAGASTLHGRHGLGLAIAREIVTRHGGTIEVASKVGQGSEFVVSIPAAGGPTSS